MHQSKIEQAQEKMEELRQELRTQVQDEVRSNVRTRTWRRVVTRIGGCCGIYLLALLTIPVIVLYLVARTGIVPVPWFAERVAHERVPTRVVSAVPATFDQLFAAKFRAAIRSGERPTQVTLAVSEGELTGLLRSILEDRGALTSEARAAAQVVVAADSAELFTRVPAIGGGETTLRIRAVPTVREGTFALDLREVAIGNLGIPRVLAQAFVGSFLGQMSSPSMSLAAGGVRLELAIERIALGDGQAQITFRTRSP